MKQGTTFTEGWRQVHSDPQTTVLARSHEEKGYVDTRHQDDRSNQPITLRSRSRTKAEPRSYRSQHTSQGFHLYPRDRHQPPKTRYASSQREPSQSEAESAQVTIPPADTLEQPDWNRSSEEREPPEPREEDLMAIPKTQSLEEDWKISVQKAFNDPTRTKAPCEIPGSQIQLSSTISKKTYEQFVAILEKQNPTTPREVLGNMATIFAQSGKMDRRQAEGSYTFTVPNSVGFGLFVPTNFKSRKPFQDNDSNVYHFCMVLQTKELSMILAEELIRPGDFTINQDLAQCGYPSYGYYSAGEVAAKTVPFASSLKELSRKILKIGKGVLPVFIGGIFKGRNQHLTQSSGGNDEIQRLCGEHGAARGREKYLVARSECTTVHGVVITYKNAIQPVRHTLGS